MRKRICVAILAMGLSGLVAEILLLREFLIVFSGNELSTGLVLANWLLLEALGSYLYRRRSGESPPNLAEFAILSAILCAALFLAIFLIRILRRAIGLSIGESVTLLPMVCSTLLVLAPVSIPHGALFTLSCEMYSVHRRRGAPSASRVYAYETAGTVIGTVVCNYLLIPYLDAFQAASGLATLNLATCLALLIPFWKSGQ